MDISAFWSIARRKGPYGHDSLSWELLCCSPPQFRPTLRWSARFYVQISVHNCFSLSMYSLQCPQLSREAGGQLWAWCGEPRPVAAGLDVDGSLSSRASL